MHPIPFFLVFFPCMMDQSFAHPQIEIFFFIYIFYLMALCTGTTHKLNKKCKKRKKRKENHDANHLQLVIF